MNSCYVKNVELRFEICDLKKEVVLCLDTICAFLNLHFTLYGILVVFMGSWHLDVTMVVFVRSWYSLCDPGSLWDPASLDVTIAL